MLFGEELPIKQTGWKDISDVTAFVVGSERIDEEEIKALWTPD